MYSLSLRDDLRFIEPRLRVNWKGNDKSTVRCEFARTSFAKCSMPATKRSRKFR